MNRHKTIIFLGDGMADEPLDELDGRTPLQAADTPAMDAIAGAGRCGTLLTLPDEFPTSSDVANMSVLGCNLATDYCGRGPLEAAGRGIRLEPDDIAFRVNLVTTESGILTDFSGGHPDQAISEQFIKALAARLGSDTVRFYSGVSYRNILVLSGAGLSAAVDTEKPDDNHGERMDGHLPRARTPEAAHTVEILRRLIAEAPAVLAESGLNDKVIAAGHSPVNAIWPWSGGRTGELQTLNAKYGISSAVISAVDVIMGLGICLGMTPISVEGATGYIDTNYEGKADAAIAAIRDHDLVYLHVEAIDEVSHAQDLEKKIMAIEDFDRRVVSRVAAKLPDDVATVVLPDHPVPIALGKHTRVPVPVAVCVPGEPPDTVSVFDELACPTGALGAMRNGDLMNLLFLNSGTNTGSPATGSRRRG